MRYLLITILVLAAITIGFGQKPSIHQDNRLMSLGSRPSFQLVLPGAQQNVVEKLWKDYAKQQLNAKMKYDKKAKEWMALDANTSSLAVESGDLYSTVAGRGEDVVLTLWVDAGASFVNAKDNPESVTNVETLLTEFQYVVQRDLVQKEVESEEEKQKNLDKKLAKLVKDKDGLHKDIQEYEEKIRKAREAIKNNETEQVATKKEIEVQQGMLDKVRAKLDKIGKN